MINNLLKSLIIISLLLSQLSFADDSNNAKVSLFVFFKGDPLYQIDVIEDERIIGSTDQYGNVVLSMTPGIHKITLKSQEDEVYQYELNFHVKLC